MQAVRSFQHRPLDIADPAGEQRIRQWILDIASHPFRLDSDW